jgi:hypothetical protein
MEEGEAQETVPEVPGSASQVGLANSEAQGQRGELLILWTLRTARTAVPEAREVLPTEIPAETLITEEEEAAPWDE